MDVNCCKTQKKKKKKKRKSEPFTDGENRGHFLKLIVGSSCCVKRYRPIWYKYLFKIFNNYESFAKMKRQRKRLSEDFCE